MQVTTATHGNQTAKAPVVPRPTATAAAEERREPAAEQAREARQGGEAAESAALQMSNQGRVLDLVA